MKKKHIRSLDIFITNTMGEMITTKPEEIELSKRILAGDDSAIFELVQRNMKFAWHMAKQYTGKGVEIEVLVQEAALAMMKAAGKFDATKGMKFVNYASWYVKAALGDSICKIGHAVSFPKFNFSHVNARRIIDEMEGKLGRQPTNAEFEKETGASGNICGIVKLLYLAPISMDVQIDGDNAKSGTVMDSFAHPGVDPDRELEAESDGLLVNRLLHCLSDRERMVLRRFFGLRGAIPETLTKIGIDIGISRERTRQIKLEALGKLKFAAEMDGLSRRRKAKALCA